MEGALALINLSWSPALSEFLDILAHVPNWDSYSPCGDGGQYDREEISEMNRLANLEEEFANALIDISRTNTEPISRAEALLERAKLLRACDYFKAHAPHLKLYFRDEVPHAVSHDETSVVETLSLPPCGDLLDVQGCSALDQCMMVTLDHLHSMGKSTVGLGENDEERDLVCHLHPSSSGSAIG